MEQRNLILAIVLSVAILLGFQIFLAPKPSPVGDQAGPSATTSAPQAPDAPAPPSGDVVAPSPGTGAPATAVVTPRSRAEILAATPRVRIETPAVRGSIALVGARIDDLVLKRYRETIDENSPNIVLLSPPGSEHPYFADFRWTSSRNDIDLPDATTRWQADGKVLSPTQPITLSWRNEQGLRFELRFEIDDHYMFTVTQRVVNEGAAAVPLLPYGLISRTGTPKTLGYYILHEGLLGVLDGTLKEVDYKDLRKNGLIQDQTTGGWLGITDKYWLVALVPDQTRPVNARFVYSGRDNVDKYQADFLYQGASVAAGSSTSVTSRLFAGAKEVTLLDRYRDELGIARFDLAVDFGWFYFLTKPLFYALHYVAQITGNFGVAILLLTVAIKLLFFPLANKSYNAMAKMRKLQPEIARLRERFGDDRQRLNQEMMALYRKEGTNPVSGCLPIIIQIPVFFALYKVMFVTIEMRHAPFFGWIKDLSAPDPTSILNGFGLLPWMIPDLGPLNVLNIGAWPLVMGLTMFLQQKLNPQPPDPVQAKIFMFMPIMFTFLLAQFPAGLVIYWTWNNMLSIAQQYVIMRRAGVSIGGKGHKAGTV
ncbi:MAG: membrane protein insertase YidC [Alphaproteobacteria bacterium]|nr:MAG: membrane protein insertase YidC [Alphaproteobacteria bacterium]